MSTAVSHRHIPFRFDPVHEGRTIIEDEAAALSEVARRLDQSFETAVRTILDRSGSVIVSGMGKAGLIGQKISATMSSTGTRSHFLHPAEAVHGDLGCLHNDDVLLALSNSGETEEICRLLPLVERLGVPIIAVTATHTSTLGSQADVVLAIGRLQEAGHHGLAPSTTTTAMLAVGDALALVLSRQKNFTPRQFAIYHPAGSLGERLKTISQVMRKGDELRVARDNDSIRDIFVRVARPGRRTGAVMLIDAEERLSGVFTDSDLARLLEQRRETKLDGPISDVMTRHPLTISPSAVVADAVEILSKSKISELPVVDEDGRPIGMIDITDVIALIPSETRAGDAAQKAAPL